MMDESDLVDFLYNYLKERGDCMQFQMLVEQVSHLKRVAELLFPDAVNTNGRILDVNVKVAKFLYRHTNAFTFATGGRISLNCGFERDTPMPKFPETILKARGMVREIDSQSGNISIVCPVEALVYFTGEAFGKTDTTFMEDIDSKLVGKKVFLNARNGMWNGKVVRYRATKVWFVENDFLENSKEKKEPDKEPDFVLESEERGTVCYVCDSYGRIKFSKNQSDVTAFFHKSRVQNIQNIKDLSRVLKRGSNVRFSFVSSTERNSKDAFEATKVWLDNKMTVSYKKTDVHDISPGLKRPVDDEQIEVSSSSKIEKNVNNECGKLSFHQNKHVIKFGPQFSLMADLSESNYFIAGTQVCDITAELIVGDDVNFDANWIPVFPNYSATLVWTGNKPRFVPRKCVSSRIHQDGGRKTQANRVEDASNRPDSRTKNVEPKSPMMTNQMRFQGESSQRQANSFKRNSNDDRFNMKKTCKPQTGNAPIDKETDRGYVQNEKKYKSNTNMSGRTNNKVVIEKGIFSFYRNKPVIKFGPHFSKMADVSNSRAFRNGKYIDTSELGDNEHVDFEANIISASPGFSATLIWIGKKPEETQCKLYSNHTFNGQSQNASQLNQIVKVENKTIQNKNEPPHEYAQKSNDAKSNCQTLKKLSAVSSANITANTSLSMLSKGKIFSDDDKTEINEKSDYTSPKFIKSENHSKSKKVRETEYEEFIKVKTEHQPKSPPAITRIPKSPCKAEQLIQQRSLAASIKRELSFEKTEISMPPMLLKSIKRELSLDQSEIQIPPPMHPGGIKRELSFEKSIPKMHRGKLLSELAKKVQVLPSNVKLEAEILDKDETILQNDSNTSRLQENELIPNLKTAVKPKNFFKTVIDKEIVEKTIDAICIEDSECFSSSESTSSQPKFLKTVEDNKNCGSLCGTKSGSTQRRFLKVVPDELSDVSLSSNTSEKDENFVDITSECRGKTETSESDDFVHVEYPIEELKDSFQDNAETLENKASKGDTKPYIKYWKSLEGSIVDVTCQFGTIECSTLGDEVVFYWYNYFENGELAPELYETLDDGLKLGHLVNFNCFEILTDDGQLLFKAPLVWRGKKPDEKEVTAAEYIRDNKIRVTLSANNDAEKDSTAENSKNEIHLANQLNSTRKPPPIMNEASILFDLTRDIYEELLKTNVFCHGQDVFPTAAEIAQKCLTLKLAENS